MSRSNHPAIHPVRFTRAILVAVSVGALIVSGCAPGGGGGGEGPGHRQQALALTPEQELQFGREASEEILSQPEKYGHALPSDSPEVQRVRKVAGRIIKASQIEPLQREINLHVQGYDFEWDEHVLKNPQVNAFCLPAGKIFVFTGLLPVAENDDQLATVLSHEIAHALAHHASERVARELKDDPNRRGMGIFTLLRSKAYDRQQETEADHIGIFLMTFAGYDPRQAVVFWQRMEQLSSRGRPPEILSDHPSDARRIQAIEEWVPRALAGKKAFDEGRIAPAR
jgi:metalloendopeptidase OMA1, mitochondrial